MEVLYATQPGIFRRVDDAIDKAQEEGREIERILVSQQEFDDLQAIIESMAKVPASSLEIRLGKLNPIIMRYRGVLVEVKSE